MEITLKRAYEPPDPADGVRIHEATTGRRGVRKDAAAIDHRLKEIAPSPALRKWFAHDPKKWAEFRRRYERELRGKRAEIASRHNNAVVLRDYLLRLEQKGSAPVRRRR